jgi:type 1 glutamine amidotransferase
MRMHPAFAGFLCVVVLCICSSPQAAPKAPLFKAVAFYNGTWDGAHIAFCNYAKQWFPKAATANNFTFEATNNWGNLNATFLSTCQVVIFLDDAPKDAGQRTAFQNFMTNGGGWLGFHVCIWNSNPGQWSWYYNTFVGVGSFAGNNWLPTSALLKNEMPTHPVMKRVPAAGYRCPANEWYRWSLKVRSNPDMKVIMSIDSSSYPQGTTELLQKGDDPVVWTNTKYKMVYMNMGHGDNSLVDTTQNRMIVDAILWLGGATTNSVERILSRDQNNPASVNCTVRQDRNSVSFAVAGAGRVAITIVDHRGRVVMWEQGTKGECRFDRSKIGAGDYLLRINSDAGIGNQKVHIE